MPFHTPPPLPRMVSTVLGSATLPITACPLGKPAFFPGKRTCSYELSTVRCTAHRHFRSNTPYRAQIPFDWVLRAFPLDEQHTADLDENQSNLTIPSSPRSNDSYLAVRADTSFSQFGIGSKRRCCHGHNPRCFGPLRVLALGLGRSVVLEIRKSITEDGSSALATDISCRLCSRGLASGARRHRVKTFPSSLGPPKRAAIAQSTD